MKYLITTLALLLAINFAGINTAHADIKAYVKNCTDNKLTIYSYNPKDSARTIEYDGAQIEAGDGDSLKCKGQGKGFCRLEIYAPYSCTKSPGHFVVKANKKKWIKVDGCNVYQKDLSSEPSCD